MTHPGTLTWFAQHESRLAWRDWISMITAGRRERMRTVAIAIVAFAIFMHFVAYSMVGRFARRPLPTSRRWWSSPAARCCRSP